jgi:serine/threonine-protein kinase
LIDVCQALTEAHDAGMIHRDIKPANIFASQRGGIYDFTKLLDFGVVREIKVDANLSLSSKMVAGTPSYMSPEQAARPDQIDSRTDIYSLGAVAYFLLTGRPPFVGKTPMQVMLAQVNQPPEVPSMYRAGIPLDLESVVMRCLAKDVSERISSAAELRSELEQCGCAGTWTQADAVTWWRESAIQTAKSLESEADTIVVARG